MKWEMTVVVGGALIIYPRGDIRMLSSPPRQTVLKQKASAYSLQTRGALNFRRWCV